MLRCCLLCLWTCAALLVPAEEPEWPGDVSDSLKKGLSQAQYIQLLDKALDGIIAKCQDAAPPPIFSANLFLAHECAIKAVPLPCLIKYVDALKDAGARRVDINMGLFPWIDQHQPTIDKYDALITHIRKLGLQLALNPEYGSSHLRVSSFDEWQRKALSFYAEIARRYQPEIFVVIHEPTTMAYRMKQKVSVEQWADFVEEGAKVVKAASPQTRCGASCLSYEEEYFEKFLRMKRLDLLGFDIYALRALDKYNRMIAAAKKAGKAVYIEETWRPPCHTPEPGEKLGLDQFMGCSIGSKAFEDLDCKWLEAMALYAGKWELEAITPFWSTTFFCYLDKDINALDREYILKVLEAIQLGQRTKTFRTFKELAARAAKGR